MHFRLIAFFAFSVLVLFAFVPARSTNEDYVWITHGPYGGSLRDLLPARGHPGVLFAVTQDDLYRSSSYGKSWIRTYLNQGTVIVRQDPKRTNHLIAAQFNVFESQDLGNSWTPIHSFYSEFKAELEDIVFDAVNTKVLYAGFCCGIGLGRSTDGGIHWTHLPVPRSNWSTVLFAASIQNQSSVLYLLMDTYPSFQAAELFASYDSGNTWKKITVFPGMQYIKRFIASPADPRLLFIGYNSSVGPDPQHEGILRSEDGGITWKHVHYGPVNEISFDPADPTHLIGCGNTVYETLDSGKHWRLLNSPQSPNFLSCMTEPGLIVLGPVFLGAQRSTDSGSSWQGANQGLTSRQVTSLSVNAARPSEILGFAPGGNVRTTNSGNAWDAWPSFSGRFHPSNPDLIAAPGFHADPVNHRKRGLALSTDDGDHWTLRGPYHQTCCLQWDPRDQQTFYFAERISDDYRLARSSDQGQTWVSLPATFSYVHGKPIVAIGGNPSVIYAALYVDAYRKFLRSSDSGQTWTSVLPGLEGDVIRDIAVDPRNGNTVYVAMERGEPIFSTVYKSTDAGSHWVKSDSGLPTYSLALVSIAIDPNKPEVLYVGGAVGLFTSSDAGATWTPLPVPQGGILDVAVGGASGSSLFVSNFKGVFHWAEQN